MVPDTATIWLNIEILGREDKCHIFLIKIKCLIPLDKQLQISRGDNYIKFILITIMKWYVSGFTVFSIRVQFEVFRKELAWE